MATSRLEKIGTIYSRITGLIRAGALKHEDRPIWFDVYEAFPPKNEIAATLSNAPLPKILYPEDLIRAKFHKVHNETINLSSDSPTKCQRFIELFHKFEAENRDKSIEDVFDLALNDFKAGAPMKEAEEINNLAPSLSASFKLAKSDQQIKLSKKVDISDVMKED